MKYLTESIQSIRPEKQHGDVAATAGRLQFLFKMFFHVLTPANLFKNENGS